MARTKAGSSLDDAIKISFADDRFQQQLRGSVSGSDPNRFYRFEVAGNLSRVSYFGATLRDLDNDADLYLLDSRGRIISFSANAGEGSEALGGTADAIAAGTYYLQVKRVRGNTSFKLNVAVSPINSPEFRVRQPRITETFGPKDLARARRVNFVGGTRIIEDSVGGGNTQDFYRFDLPRFAFVNFFLRDLDGNVDIDLLNSQGQVLRRSGNRGSESETINISRSIPPGTYFVRVYRRGNASTNYDLALSGTFDFSRRVTPPSNQGLSPTLVENINPGSANSSPTELAVFNDVVYFAATDSINGRELWRSNGTAEGTQLLLNINPGAASSNPSDLFVSGGFLYFSANNGINGTELWRTNGTAEGTELVVDLNPGAAGSNPTDFATFNDVLYFAAANANNGRELFRSDGTPAGTTLVSDINSGPGSSNPTDLVALGDSLYFAADDGTFGSELYRSNGTAAGTRLVLNINPGSVGSNPTDLVNFNGTLYFAADDGISGRELFRSDGTANGTVLAATIRASSESSTPTDLIQVGSLLYFAADDGTRGRELWRSDGTQNGTVLVSDVNPGQASSNPADLINSNGILYFAATSSIAGRQIFRSNGSAQGTVLVTNSAFTTLDPAELLNVGTLLYFAGNTAATGVELYTIPI